MSKRTIISRRAMLRGTIGGTAVAVALPPLQAMFNGNGTAYAADGSAIQPRLGLFFWGNGVKLDRWVPADTGAGWTPSPALAPLAGVKEYVSVVSGMRIMSGNIRGHHSGVAGIMSGCEVTSQPHPNSNYVSTYTKPSIDQVLADDIERVAAMTGAPKLPFRSLEVGISRKVVGGEGTTLKYLSHKGPDSPNPPEYDPGKVYDRLFASLPKPGTGTPVVDKTLALRRSVLDAVIGDLGDLRGRVGAADKMRLDRHADNIRTIENRLMNMTPTTATPAICTAPQARPGSFPDVSGKEQIKEKMVAMSNLVALALACNQTRAFSVMFTGSVGFTVFWQVDATSGHHDLTHNEAGDQPLVHASTVFTMEMFAVLLQALKDQPEGAGNVLDNTVILASSDVADGKAHSNTNYPILVAGGGGGKLRKPGVHYKSNGENTSKVLLTILRAAGMSGLTEFGTDGGRVTEGCTAIEA